MGQRDMDPLPILIPPLPPGIKAWSSPRRSPAHSGSFLPLFFLLCIPDPAHPGGMRGQQVTKLESPVLLRPLPASSFFGAVGNICGSEVLHVPVAAEGLSSLWSLWEL